MNEAMMKEWERCVWAKRAHQDKTNLLVLDSFKGHLVPEVKNLFALHNTRLATIPGGLTSAMQPLDLR